MSEIMPPEAVKSDEDLLTIAQVRDLLEQQKCFYKDLLQQQESTYKGFVQMLMDSFNKRPDGVLKELCYKIQSTIHPEGCGWVKITFPQLVNSV